MCCYFAVAGRAVPWVLLSRRVDDATGVKYAFLKKRNCNCSTTNHVFSGPTEANEREEGTR
jgi:hypothetical protein